MSNCLFPWCLPMFVEDHSSNGAASISKVDSSGVLQIPTYRPLGKEQSKLLQACWAQNWNEALQRCQDYPHEASHMTQQSGRTALHLATFTHPCPMPVAQALLRANRHMVLVQDANWYTPLHNVAFFHHDDANLVKSMCDTAIMVEQELQGQHLPPLSGTSPLFLAAKRAAPLRTLKLLLETRQHTLWMAPSTGAEPYWMETLDEYSSPLEILLRDRAVTTWGLRQRIPSSSSILRPRLLWQMKHAAQERFIQSVVCNKNTSNDKDKKTSSAEAVATQPLDWLLLDDPNDGTTEDEVQALLLWTKCVELLAEHVPRLYETTTLQWSPAAPATEQHSKQDFAVVHCVASAKVPLPNLLQVALLVFPEQALMRDEYGMLPLHHVLYAKHPYATKTLVTMLLNHAPQAVLNACPPPPQQQHGDDTAVTENLPDVSKDSIQTLSSSTSITPLLLALELGLSLDILKELLWADSDVTLTTIDPMTGLYPFAVAACKGYDLDVVFTLLNAHPQVLNQFLVQ